MVAETHHYVIVNKPALLDSQNSKPGRPSVVDWLKSNYGFPGLVHRLDFGTSGLMVCAKNAEAAADLTKKMQQGAIKRTYQAVTLGRIEQDRGEWSWPVEGNEALTRFKVLERFANATLLELELETGRKHQIRRHAAEAGHYLLGDHLYGRKGAQKLFDRPALHATRLEVAGAQYSCELPEDLISLMARLRKATRS